MVVVTRYVPQPSIRTSIIHSAQPTALHPFLRWQGNWLEWIPSHTRPSTRFVSQLNPIAIVYPFIHPGPHWLQFPQRSAPRESVLSVHARLDNFFPKWASLINITTSHKHSAISRETTQNAVTWVCSLLLLLLDPRPQSTWPPRLLVLLCQRSEKSPKHYLCQVKSTHAGFFPVVAVDVIRIGLEAVYVRRWPQSPPPDRLIECVEFRSGHKTLTDLVQEALINVNRR